MNILLITTFTISFLYTGVTSTIVYTSNAIDCYYDTKGCAGGYGTPKTCPPGTEQTSYVQMCANCSGRCNGPSSTEKAFVAVSSIGCPSTIPWLGISVRECTPCPLWDGTPLTELVGRKILIQSTSDGVNGNYLACNNDVINAPSNVPSSNAEFVISSASSYGNGWDTQLTLACGGDVGPLNNNLACNTSQILDGCSIGIFPTGTNNQVSLQSICPFGDSNINEGGLDGLTVISSAAATAHNLSVCPCGLLVQAFTGYGKCWSSTCGSSNYGTPAVCPNGTSQTTLTTMCANCVNICAGSSLAEIEFRTLSRMYCSSSFPWLAISMRECSSCKATCTNPLLIPSTISPNPSPTTFSPTLSPTTLLPTLSPNLSPTFSPTLSPTLPPTLSPNLSPTLSPTPSPNSSLVLPSPPPPFPVGLVVGVVCGIVAVLILILVFVILLCKKCADTKPPDTLTTIALPDISTVKLPPEIAWSFEEANLLGEENRSFKINLLDPKSESYNTVISMFHNHLGGKDVSILEVYEVYPKHLLDAFTTYEHIYNERLKTAPHLFQPKWQDNDPDGLRKWVMDRFFAFTNSFPWNTNRTIKIIPQVHGTDFESAMAICNTGFATLALLDKGWYGKGIYFTSSAVYSVPYFSTKSKPTIIISYIIPGNPYPVTEHPMKDKNLVGAGMQNGAQSHYVVTSINGYPVSIPQDGYDELIISQEAQALPAFILVVDKSCLDELSRKYQREVVENQYHV